MRPPRYFPTYLPSLCDDHLWARRNQIRCEPDLLPNKFSFNLKQYFQSQSRISQLIFYSWRFTVDLERVNAEFCNRKYYKMQKVSCMIISIVILAIIAVVDNAAPPVPLDVGQLKPSVDGEAPCRVFDTIIEHGQEWTYPAQCINYFCYDGKILDLDYCDELKTTGPNCVIVPLRSNLDWPYCCPKVVCD